MDKLTEERRVELEAKLSEMDHVVKVFYSNAVRVGVHPFIEFCGFMREYLKLAKWALDAGIDFAGVNDHASDIPSLPMEAFHAQYLGEKFGCIFKPWFAQHPEKLELFLIRSGLKPGPEEADDDID